jgi:poly-gamma-glutamate synthesis protein (capsule biosynthesis protein)
LFKLLFNVRRNIVNIINRLKKIYLAFTQRTKKILTNSSTSTEGVYGVSERISEPLSVKKKLQKDIAHRQPISIFTCTILIVTLFIALFVHTNLPDNRSIQNTSPESLFAHADSNANTVFTATFVGDIMLGRGLQDASEFYGYDSYFKKTKDYFENFDLVVGNFENPIVHGDKKAIVVQRGVTLSANSECLGAMKNAGFNMLSLANNHILDYEVTGMLNTMESLDQVGIAYFGAGRDVNEAKGYQVIESNGTKIAVIGINEVPGYQHNSKNVHTLFTIASEKVYLDAVSEAASVVDVVIVFMHWGDEYTAIVSSNQQEIGRKLIDAGADIVIGRHSHVLQPIEIYGKGVIFYSLGNFVFDQGWSRTKDSCIVRYCLDENGRGVFELIPLRINNGSPAETSNPIFVNRIFHTLTKNLSSEKYVLDNGRLYIRSPTIKLS